MADLLVSVHTPVLRSGRAMRTYGIARALAQRGDGLHFVYVRFGGTGPDEHFAAIPGIRFHEVVPSRGMRRLAAYGAARVHGVPDAFARAVSPELADAVTRLGADEGGARVIADGPSEAAALAGLSARRPVVYNAHNLESGFRAQFDRSLGDPARLARFERGVLARSAESWVVSDADLRAARELCPQARLKVIPNVVDVTAIAPTPPDPAARRVLLVGSFGYEPNRRGLRFLVDEVLPRVWAAVPDARLRVVGAGLSQAPSDDPRVEWMGFVEEIDSAYAHVSCVAVPLLQGGGSPVKFVEAMAHGLPVIATPSACAGLDVADGEHCLVADGADAFAAGLVTLLQDGRPDLGPRARHLAEERYSIEAIAELVS